MPSMKSNKNGPVALILEALALLPWWACTAAAVFSLVYFHLMVEPADVGSLTGGLHLAAINVAKYAVPTLLLAAAGMSYLARAHRKDLVKQALLQRTLDGMSWQDFELLVGESFRQRGYKVRELGGAGPDGGVDLVLTKDGETYLVQCKQWKALKVGVEIVREIFGVMTAHGATGSYVVTSGRFTEPAKAFAKGRNIFLLDGPALMTLLEQGKHGDEPTDKPQTNSSQRPITTGTSRPPPCPTCGVAMVKRQSRSSKNGFWGCTQFPRCKGTRPL